MRQRLYTKADKTGGGRRERGETQFFRPQQGPPSYGESRTEKNWVEPLIVAIFFLFSFFLMFHTFGYDAKTHTILISGKLWSDFGAHIPLIRSFSMGQNWPPEYPIYPGEPIRYHFLFYALVGLLEKAGLRLDWALNIPSAVGFFLLLWGIWTLSKKLFDDTRVATLSIIFFLFNGSLSFIQFFQRQPLTLQDFPAFGPWDGGVITAFWNLNIYTNQRHLAWGFALGIWFFVWVVSSKKSVVGTILWGVAIGLLPYFHQPMLLVFAILLAWYFLVSPNIRRPLIVAGCIAALLIVLQLGEAPMFRPEQGPPSYGESRTENIGASLLSVWYPGYLVHDQLTVVTFLSFWFQNLGLHAILIPTGFLLLSKRTQKILVPLFLIFIMGNLFKFSMEVSANHKFFNFALILGNMITAYTIIRFLSSIKGITVITIIMLTFSGIIDLLVIVNDTKGTLADVGNNQVATWIATNTPKDAVFLNSSFLYHPASLAGRKVFLGWPYFAWSAGYDTYGRMAEMRTMYESEDPKIFCPILEKHNISYITVEDTSGDPNLPVIDTNYFLTSFDPVYRNESGTYAIFTTADLSYKTCNLSN